jgi:hypothetical protein
VAEFTPALAGRVARMALFDCWSWQLEGGHLSRKGLLAVRGRLDETSGEFAPGPDLDLLRLVAADALAADLGVDAADLPGAEVVPDSPEDMPPPRPRW